MLRIVRCFASNGLAAHCRTDAAHPCSQLLRSNSSLSPLQIGCCASFFAAGFARCAVVSSCVAFRISLLRSSQQTSCCSSLSRSLASCSHSSPSLLHSSAARSSQILGDKSPRSLFASSPSHPQHIIRSFASLSHSFSASSWGESSRGGETPSRRFAKQIELLKQFAFSLRSKAGGCFCCAKAPFCRAFSQLSPTGSSAFGRKPSA